MQSAGYSIERKDVIPHEPGVYKFYNKESQLIYVGKAKDLKKRVYSYFNKLQGHNRKTRKLVSEIVKFDFTIVNNEVDALLLENNLIKQNQPKYNILLKDDKTFPYICITKERFPRIITTRKLNKDKGEYFGPYSSVVAMNTVLDLIRKLYTIRTCKLHLSKKNIEQKKFKVCLEYHIGNCLGPCEGLQSESDYNHDIQSVRKILKGSLIEVKDHFKTSMQKAADQLRYEEAEKFKTKLDHLLKFQSKSTVVNPKLSNLAVFTITEDDKYAFVNYMFVENGAITTTKTFEVKKILDEKPEDILETISYDAIKDSSINRLEILSNLEYNLGETQSIIPQIGDKKKLIDLSLRNAFEYKKNKLLKKPIHDKSIIVLEQLKTDLSLKTLPKHIECFDNSNIQGTNPVASMVCFKKGKPSKKDYRHYNIKTVVGPDDFASMYEVVTRRYKKLKEEGLSYPDLIVIDGGKGQLSMVKKALVDLGIYGEIPVIGIAKKLEEIYFPEDKYPVHISKKSITLRLLQHLRDEAHRFAITFHRLKRSKGSLASELTEIKGIGSETADKLIKQFKSIKKIKEASKEEITQLIGTAKAKLILTHFK
ncbi:excinuclease ABC subunit UvrC [Fulvivirga lutea]|uniref:UvrABC system protein C n=1 Tax=Fulvivirga lutea TaxID=2810512 RepID=A0A974WJK7_9BACT|nr:excinuclease ABC subunit UvrC [Fulvivirga lutea]QSE98342.1 excinuclease ABC subunit UvrC [Fulvivirga lutea]